MATYLRVQDGVAVEEWNEPKGFTINECFAPEIVENFYPKGSAEIGWVWDGNNFSKPTVRSTTKDDLVSYAAVKRFYIETGGYSFNGHPISTDRASQSKIGNVTIAANAIGPSFSTMWKCADGTFLSLNHDDAVSMASAIMAFVSNCFITEASVVNSINGGTITTFAAVDAAAWPANS